METTPVHDAITALEKANANLDPDLVGADDARDLLAAYARAEKLAGFGKTVLAQRLADATEVARVTGTSIGKAKTTVATGTALGAADHARSAFSTGTISLDQATEIARAEQASPSSGPELVAVATTAPFHVLKDRARRIVLEADQGRRPRRPPAPRPVRAEPQ